MAQWTALFLQWVSVSPPSIIHGLFWAAEILGGKEASPETCYPLWVALWFTDYFTEVLNFRHFFSSSVFFYTFLIWLYCGQKACYKLLCNFQTPALWHPFVVTFYKCCSQMWRTPGYMSFHLSLWVCLT